MLGEKPFNRGPDLGHRALDGAPPARWHARSIPGGRCVERDRAFRRSARGGWLRKPGPLAPKAGIANGEGRVRIPHGFLLAVLALTLLSGPGARFCFIPSSVRTYRQALHV